MAISVVHLSASAAHGGAARSAMRIHRGLQDMGVRSRMLAGRDDATGKDIAPMAPGRIRHLDHVGRFLADPLGFQALCYPSTFLLSRHPYVREARIIQLYTIHGGFMSLTALPWLARGKDVVLRLSDQWSMTGGCAYPGPCGRWRECCGSCPDLASYPPALLDVTAAMWRLKRSIFARIRPTVVATNSVMREAVRQSPILAGLPCETIPNGVDETIFFPHAKATARESLGLAGSDLIVLFCAHVASVSTRKGGLAAMEAMKQAAASTGRSLTLLVMGEGAEGWPDGSAYETVRLGYSREDRFIALAMAAADVLLAPSLAENLPNTVIEAMACGTPVVGYASGGMADAVRHGQTGLLAPEGAVDTLALELARMLTDGDFQRACGVRGRTVVEENFAASLQARRFKALYESLAT